MAWGARGFDSHVVYRLFVYFFRSLLSPPPRKYESASYAALEDWVRAVDDAKECVRLDPTFVKGYYRLALALTELEELDKAAAAVRQGLQVEPHNPQLTKQLRVVKQLHKKQKHQKQQQQQLSSQAPPSSVLGGGGGGGGGIQIDEAAAREIQDLQTQYGQTSRERAQAQATLQQVQRELQMTEMTKLELENDPVDVAPTSSSSGDSKQQHQPAAGAAAEKSMYRSIGKIFLRSSKADVMDFLDAQLESNKKKEHDATQKLEYLDRRLKSQRQNIEEIFSSATSASAATAAS